MSTSPKPLLFLVQAERRIKSVEPRDFISNPWMIGEGARFWSPDRVAKLAAENEAARKRKIK
jgi:hypothetical protein